MGSHAVAGFTGTLALQLGAGDYDVGVLCTVCSDPSMTINFDIPVDGVNPVSPVPEAAGLALLASGILGLLSRRRRQAP